MVNVMVPYVLGREIKKKREKNFQEENILLTFQKSFLSLHAL